MGTARSWGIRRGFVGSVIVVSLIALVRLWGAIEQARSIPFSPLVAGWRVGPEYLERNAVPTTGARAGEVDDFGVFARSDFDPDQVHHAVRRFYERTADHRLTYAVTWHRGFRIGAALVSPLTGRIEQLNLPAPGETGHRELRSRIIALDARADPRRDARAWIRVDPMTDEAVFVAMYALHAQDGCTYTNVAVPLPGANLSTILHINSLKTDADNDEGWGVVLTTTPDTDTGTDAGDGGLYLVTPFGAITLPMEQTFRVWPADATNASAAPDVSDTADRSAGIVATHEMQVYGRTFLTIAYRGWPEDRL